MSPSTTESAIASPLRWFRHWRWRGVAGRAPTLFIEPQRVWHAERGAPLPLACENFESWCAQHHGGAVRLVLSGRLTHSFAVDAALPLASDEDLRQYARTQFIHYHGASAGDWATAAWVAGEQRGASALHGIDWTKLQATAQRHDVRLLSAVPWWSVALRAAHRLVPSWPCGRGRGALVLVEGTHLSWLLLQDGLLIGIKARRLPDATASAVAQLVSELSGSDGVIEDHMVIAGCGISDDAKTAALAASHGEVQLSDRPHPAIAWLFE